VNPVAPIASAPVGTMDALGQERDVEAHLDDLA
jgi:hypothetical protein